MPRETIVEVALPWIRVEDDFADDVRHERLAKALEITVDRATLLALRLLTWASSNAQDGLLDRISDVHLARGLRWPEKRAAELRPALEGIFVRAGRILDFDRACAPILRQLAKDRSKKMKARSGINELQTMSPGTKAAKLGAILEKAHDPARAERVAQVEELYLAEWLKATGSPGHITAKDREAAVNLARHPSSELAPVMHHYCAHFAAVSEKTGYWARFGWPLRGLDSSWQEVLLHRAGMEEEDRAGQEGLAMLKACGCWRK